MRQFYEAYRDQGEAKVARTAEDATGPIVPAPLTQLPWTHHLIILGQCKRPEEREFYLQLAIRKRWSSRELERQLKGALFERTVNSKAPRRTNRKQVALRCPNHRRRMANAQDR